MKKEQALKRKAAALKAQLARIKLQLDKTELDRCVKKNKKLIGRCYKYRSGCGGCGKNYPDWWMFAKITGAGEWAKSLKFQHTSRNTFNIEVDDSLINLHLWTEITPEEFNSEWQKFLSKIKSLS